MSNKTKNQTIAKILEFIHELGIKKGAKFKSIHFAGIVEILSISLETNELEVLINRDTGSHPETWNLLHTQYGFERKEYFPLND